MASIVVFFGHRWQGYAQGLIGIKLCHICNHNFKYHNRYYIDCYTGFILGTWYISFKWERRIEQKTQIKYFIRY